MTIYFMGSSLPTRLLPRGIIIAVHLLTTLYTPYMFSHALTCSLFLPLSISLSLFFFFFFFFFWILFLNISHPSVCSPYIYYIYLTVCPSVFRCLSMTHYLSVSLSVSLCPFVQRYREYVRACVRASVHGCVSVKACLDILEQTLLYFAFDKKNLHP